MRTTVYVSATSILALAIGFLTLARPAAAAEDVIEGFVKSYYGQKPEDRLAHARRFVKNLKDPVLKVAAIEALFLPSVAPSLRNAGAPTGRRKLLARHSATAS